jgi:hypothetical protein
MDWDCGASTAARTPLARCSDGLPESGSIGAIRVDERRCEHDSRRTYNLNVAAPVACGTAMTDDQHNLLGATVGLGSKPGGSLTYSKTAAWSASEAFGRLFERVLGRP